MLRLQQQIGPTTKASTTPTKNSKTTTISGVWIFLLLLVANIGIDHVNCQGKFQVFYFS